MKKKWLIVFVFLLMGCQTQSVSENSASQVDIDTLNQKIMTLEQNVAQLTSDLTKNGQKLEILEKENTQKDEMIVDLKSQIKTLTKENTELKANTYMPGAVITPKGAKEIIASRVTNVMYAIRDMDFVALSKYVHPEKGLRFTPYTHIDVDKDIVFTAEEVAGFFKNDILYIWGQMDGSGDEIKGTPYYYYENFVYKADYISAPQVSYNEQISFGNIEDNSADVYKDAIRVEYYYPGFEERYEGMDWTSLRLVFQKYSDEKWYLVGIIHNMWTI